MVLIEGRIASPCQDLSGFAFDHDGPRALGIILGNGCLKLGFHDRLQVGVDGQNDIVAVDSFLIDVQGSWKQASVDHLLILDASVFSGKIIVQAFLEPELAGNFLFIFIIGGESDQIGGEWRRWIFAFCRFHESDPWNIGFTDRFHDRFIESFCPGSQLCLHLLVADGFFQDRGNLFFVDIGKQLF